MLAFIEMSKSQGPHKNLWVEKVSFGSISVKIKHGKNHCEAMAVEASLVQSPPGIIAVIGLRRGASQCGIRGTCFSMGRLL
jgi:hypothetical protein